MNHKRLHPSLRRPHTICELQTVTEGTMAGQHGSASASEARIQGIAARPCPASLCFWTMTGTPHVDIATASDSRLQPFAYW